VRGREKVNFTLEERLQYRKNIKKENCRERKKKKTKMREREKGKIA
jgi:hypothetical protein